MKVRTHFHLAKLSLRNLKPCFPENFSLNKWDIQNSVEMSSYVCEEVFRKFKNKEVCNTMTVYRVGEPQK